jgi:enoyl-CoA hydratase
MTGDILFERNGAIALVTINRPKALNALTLPMIRAYDQQLAAWAADPGVAAIVMQGAGERAFCAGGDIRAIYDAGRGSDAPIHRDFFREEYRLNRRIHRLAKSHVALLDGITMGGGVGLSVHGSHRIATERALFAMPETGIGLFPDVGGSYALPRCPGEIGMYLALTGQRLKAADMLYAGLATHHVPSRRLDDLRMALAAIGPAGSRATVDAVLASLAEPAGEAPLATRRVAIDRCFGAASIEAILDALGAEDSGAGDSGWARATRDTLLKMSPTSLKVTYRQIRSGRQLDFEACMVMEYRMIQRFMNGHDFFEGVRAAIVDKDQRPRWQPDTLQAVGAAEIEAYFAPLGARDLTFD